ALASDITGEGVAAVRPPETAAIVVVEGQHLIGERLALASLHREVAVEDVEDFGAVFEEKAMADAVVAHAVADHQIVSAVDGEPAVSAVPDRSADDGTAPHRIADQMKVEAVTTQDSALAEVAEFGVADGSGGAVMVHRVAPRDLR